MRWAKTLEKIANRGRFLNTGLQQRLKNAADTFKQVVKTVLKGLTGSIACHNDSLLYDVTMPNSKKRI